MLAYLERDQPWHRHGVGKSPRAWCDPDLGHNREAPFPKTRQVCVMAGRKQKKSRGVQGGPGRVQGGFRGSRGGVQGGVGKQNPSF